MPIERSRFLWLTDSHTHYFDRYKLLHSILDQKPKAVFLTGDISEGPAFLSDLEFFGKRIGRPLYFITGNHEMFFSSFQQVHSGIRNLCKQYNNLIWMDEQNVIELNDEVGLIGERGWYSANVGNRNYIKYTFDWFLIKEFRELNSWEERFDMFYELANNSAKSLSAKLEAALEKYKTIYLLTHFPPWIEAGRYDSFISEEFWRPYNTNVPLGKALEKVMENYKKRHLIVLSGHCHRSSTILVSKNIECRVGKGHYLKLSEDEIIYI
jgi:UDP-2,3-diacylglucosamine pyrophosphatase LpxH